MYFLSTNQSTVKETQSTDPNQGKLPDDLILFLTHCQTLEVRDVNLAGILEADPERLVEARRGVHWGGVCN